MNTSTTKKKVLILDDEVSIRQSLADYFEDNLWHTLEAESCEEAKLLLEKESPDCAIVDIRLQDRGGDIFIRDICKQKKEIAFVICTGSPIYNVPDDLQTIPYVSKRVFRKPIFDMAELEKELLDLIAFIPNKLIR